MSLPSIPKYQSLQLLGKSPFGQTLKAIHTPNQTPYSLKLFAPRSFANPQDFETAKTALKTAAHQLIALNHPQIAPYHRYFKLTTDPLNTGSHPHRILTQQWVNGDSYQTHLQRPFTEIHIHQFLQDILPVLDHLHSRHITHGDLCPSNIIFATETAKPTLINFGNPKRALARTATTPQLQTLGQRPGYSPPEQENGQAEPASDIYALGVTLLTLLSGQADSDSITRLTQPAKPNTHWLNKNALQPQSWQQALNLSPRLTELLSLMLQPSPQDRPTAADLITLCKTLQSPFPQRPAPAQPSPTTPYDYCAGTVPPPEAAADTPIEIPLSQQRTVAIGQKAVETVGFYKTGNHEYIWPTWARPAIASEPLLKLALYRVIAPMVALLAVVGFGRAAFTAIRASFSEPPQSAFAQRTDPEQDSTQDPQKTAKDCRDNVLTRGDKLDIESWNTVDAQFQDRFPDLDTIDPLNPEHRPYIQAWCDLANDWLDQQS